MTNDGFKPLGPIKYTRQGALSGKPASSIKGGKPGQKGFMSLTAHAISLGTVIDTNEDITLHPKAYALGGYFIGARRSGKSTLLQNLIAQDIERRDVGVCVIDPHADLIDKVISHINSKRIADEDVILLDPTDASFPFGINIYECTNKHDPLAVDYTVNRVMSLFKKLFYSETAQPMVEDVIRCTAYTIVANDLTMLEIPRLLGDDNYRDRMLGQVNNFAVLDFWQSYSRLKGADREQWGGVIARRIREFTASPIISYLVGQKKKILPLKEIMDGHKILLVKLYRSMPQLTSLVGSILIANMLQIALSRKDERKRPEFHLYCDEYANFATEDFATIIEEAGKYNIIPYVSHQSIGQISERNQDSAIQLSNIFCFRLIGKDAEVFAREYDNTPAPPENEQLTVPANILDLLKNHPSPHVQTLWKDVVRPWQDAIHNTLRERVTTHSHMNPLGIHDEWEETEEMLPQIDLGTGRVQDYNPFEITIALRELENLFHYYLTHPNRTDSTPHETRLLKAIRPYFSERERAYILDLISAAVSALLANSEPVMVSARRASPIHETYSEKEREIINRLVHLKQGEAMVKTPIGEYLIRTKEGGPLGQGFERKRQTIIDHTRNKYCSPRSEVEKEIQDRIKDDDPPSTQRKHTLKP